MKDAVLMFGVGLLVLVRFAADVLAVVVGLAIWNWWVGRRRERKP
jgi:hypothetical protein